MYLVRKVRTGRKRKGRRACMFRRERRWNFGDVLVKIKPHLGR